MRDDVIMVGYAGKAATGKTSTAVKFVPSDTTSGGRLAVNEFGEEFFIDHLYFSMPLYELASICLKTEGPSSYDRKLYQIHEVLLKCFGNSPLWGAPKYDELVTTVKKVASTPISDDIKPRDFLQSVGHILRAVNRDAMINYIEDIIRSRMTAIKRFYGPERELKFVFMLSDIREAHEVEYLQSYENHAVYLFEADERVRIDRLIDRDGVAPTREQLTHQTETEFDSPESKAIFDSIVDTTDMSLDEQSLYIASDLKTRFGVDIFYEPKAESERN